VSFIRARARTLLRGRFDAHPLAGLDAAGGCVPGVHLDLRVDLVPSKARELAVPGLAEARVLGAGEDQREALRPVGPRGVAHQRRLVVGKRAAAVLQHGLGVELDPPGRRGEATGHDVHLFGELAAARADGHAEATGVSATDRSFDRPDG
jgi:hypothetical protein